MRRREPPSAAGAEEVDTRYRRIWAAVARIPQGRVASYGDVARLAGLPGRARMVGRALRLAPAAMQLPWHRVVTASGRLAFATGSGAYEEQCRRLGAERVGVSAGRVSMHEHRWQPDLDELLWRPSGRWDRQP